MTRPVLLVVGRKLTPAFLGSLMVFVVGILAVVFHQPLLFPSLGPTVFIQVDSPKSAAARPWNIIVGHGLGLGAACVALVLLSAAHSQALSWRRAVASAVALGLMTAAHSLFEAAHPPGAATTLLVTLGAISLNWTSMATIIAGVLLTTILGEAFRPLLAKAS